MRGLATFMRGFATFNSYGISINEKKIATFIGEDGMLKKIQL
jgi:hypothetical protein